MEQFAQLAPIVRRLQQRQLIARPGLTIRPPAPPRSVPVSLVRQVFIALRELLQARHSLALLDTTAQAALVSAPSTHVLLELINRQRT
jgi:hypothetical protein